MSMMIDVAVTQVGVAEATGNNDGVPADRYMGGDRLPWCMGFVLYCNRLSADPKIVQPGMTKLQALELRNVHQAAALLRSLHLWFDPGAHPPQRNDVIFFWTRGISDALAQPAAPTETHVGLVEMVYADAIWTIEGNAGNAVKRVIYSRKNPVSMARIAGYARMTGLPTA